MSKDKHLLLKDILFDKEITLRDKSLTSGLKKGDLFATRLLKLDGRDMMSGCVYLVNSGGITGMKKIAALAEAHYVGMAPHNPNGPVATMMNLQFAAAIPNFYLLETVGSEADWKLWRELLDNQVKLENGCLPVPEAPGYGIELKEEGLAAHPYVPHDGWR